VRGALPAREPRAAEWRHACEKVEGKAYRIESREQAMKTPARRRPAVMPLHCFPCRHAVYHGTNSSSTSTCGFAPWPVHAPFIEEARSSPFPPAGLCHRHLPTIHRP